MAAPRSPDLRAEAVRPWYKLLDMMMPVLDGYGALSEIKNDPALRHLPVIMISALDELGSVVRCIERGAEDYLPKPFNPTLLRARIGAGLEKKRFRDQERLYVRTIEETQKRLKHELTEAENYVRSILPPPSAGPVATDWRLIPSGELGGDLLRLSLDRSRPFCALSARRLRPWGRRGAAVRHRHQRAQERRAARRRFSRSRRDAHGPERGVPDGKAK